MQDCSLEDINVYILNIKNEKRTLIESNTDIEEFFNNLNSLNIKIDKEPYLGGWCRCIIQNKKTNEEIKVFISKTQLSIGEKVYTMDKDIFGIIKNICLKYDSDAVF